MLLLLTAVCVKEERMPLNRLFEEFQKGSSFDRHSKKMIIELFDSHNILDKKVIVVMHSMSNEFYNYICELLLGILKSFNKKPVIDFIYS